MKFKYLLEKNTRIIKSLVDYKIDFYKYNSKREYWLNPKNKEEKRKKDKELELEWYKKIYDLAKNKKLIDWKTLNDLKSIGLLDKLQSELPEGKFDKI
jgi:sialic acid synthase SpsE